VRLEQRQRQSETDAQARIKRHAYEEEAILRQAYSSYLSEQREAVRLAARDEKEERARLERAEKLEREGREAFRREQVTMAREELRKVKKEEEMVAKAFVQVYFSLLV
jgi:hypothetical protein